jgi:transcriptional regulator with XRE-family HTH domain
MAARHASVMASRQRPIDRGRANASRLVTDLGRELRDARVAAGLSQRVVARAAAMNASQISRYERALVRDASVRTYSALFAVLGMRLSARPYPDGDPIRDAGQARLITRFQDRLPADARLRTEVLLGIPGDIRAWDAELTLGGDRCPIEAETALRDLQATDRRIALKLADSGETRLILLVADTIANRAVLRAHRALLRNRYPLDGREVWRAIRLGRVPEQSGIVLL